MNTPTFIWLIALPLLSSPLIYLIGQIGKRAKHTQWAYWAGFIAFAASWIPLVLSIQDLNLNGIQEFTYGTISLRMDGLSLLLAALSLGLGTFVAFYSGPYLSKEIGQEKFYAMLVAMVGVMIGLGCASDLFNLWIWFEAMAITSYLLVAFYREQPASLEAGIKYLVQSASGSILVLIGIGLVFSSTGTLRLDEIRSSVSYTPILTAAGALFIIGFGVKTALVPMHTWLPDAHSQAPSGISAMLSGVVIEAGLIAMLRTLSSLTSITPHWGIILMGFGVLNMIIGNLLALKQNQVKRMLAYSSLVHIGYMLVGIGITISLGGSGGAQGGFFHMLTHGMMKGCAFLAAGAFLYVLHISLGNHDSLLISDLAGAAKRYPIAAFALSLAVLSLGGLPPLAGFMSKWQIFVAGFRTENTWIEILVIFAALNSVFSLAYYAPLVNTIYRLHPSELVQRGTKPPILMTIPLVLLVIAIVIIGFYPSILNWLTEPAGSILAMAFGG
jgi:proton-translocating NADH-quinone oxidoreductase chain N